MKQKKNYNRKKVGKWLIGGLALLGIWSAADRVAKAKKDKEAAAMLSQSKLSNFER